MECPAGSTSPVGSSASTDCKCDPGFRGASGGPCTPCESGTFKEASGDAPCVPCPQGYTSPPESTSESSCLLQCDAGSFGPDGGPCELCPAGKFKPDAGSAPCELDCPENTDSQPGSTQLTDCICKAGYTSPANGQTCVACSAGKFKESQGTALCDTCEAGTFSQTEAAASPDTCLQCPENSLSPIGSSGPQECRCPAGFTGEDGQACEACPAGKFKVDPGAGICTDCETGTYSMVAGATSKDTCTKCSSISSSKTGAGSVTCHCNSGYTGPDLGPCSPCGVGKYKDAPGNGTCTECGAHASSPAGSTEQTSCKCNAGWEGPDGGPCTCLLYTSPSPRDLSTSRMPSSA